MTKHDLVKARFVYAHSDLMAATYMFENMPAKPFEIICYHCQQCAEKALKGYLVYHDENPPYIHDLVRLCMLCTNYDQAFVALVDSCSVLTEYSTTSRYPSDDEIDENDTKVAIKDAKLIYEICKDLTLS